MSLRLKTVSGAPVGAALAAVLVVTLAALMLALFPAVAEAQTEAQTKDENAPSVVVRPGDSLWSVSEEHLAPNASPQRIIRGAEQIYALNRNLIGADPDLIFVGQELVVPPVMSPGRTTGATPAHASAGKTTGAAKEAKEAGPRDRAAKATTGSKATAKALRTAAGGADAKGGKASAPVAERSPDRQAEPRAERQAEPVSLPDEVAAEPVPAVEKVASSGTQAEGLRPLGLVGVLLLALVVAALVAWKLPLSGTSLRGVTLASNKLRPYLQPYLQYLGMAALVVLGLPVVVLVLTLLAPSEGPLPAGAPNAAAGAHLLRSDRRLLGLGVLLLTLVVAALMAWKLPMRRTTREDAERWGIPTEYYYGAYGAAHRNNAPFATVPTGTGDNPAANGARDAAVTASVTAPAAAARRARKAKAKPRNGLALGAHSPEVRSASLRARAPARAPVRARKPRPPRRAARPPLVSAPNHKRRGEQR